MATRSRIAIKDPRQMQTNGRIECDQIGQCLCMRDRPRLDKIIEPTLTSNLVKVLETI